MYDKTKALIDDYLRPLVEADGGVIELVEVAEGRVVLRLAGAYAGCPSRSYTLDRVIAPALKRALGEDITIEAKL